MARRQAISTFSKIALIATLLTATAHAAPTMMPWFKTKPSPKSQTYYVLDSGGQQTFSILTDRPPTDPSNNYPITLASVITTGTQGTVSVSGSNILYAPPATPTTDSFSYVVKNSLGRTASNKIKVIVLDAYTWTGKTNANFADPGNWCGSIADSKATSVLTACSNLASAPPGTSDTVYFDDSCTMNCTPTAGFAANVYGIRMSTSFPGVLSPGSSTIGLGGLINSESTGTDWAPSAGANITINGPMSVGSNANNKHTSGTEIYNGTVTLSHHGGYLAGTGPVTINGDFANSDTAGTGLVASSGTMTFTGGYSIATAGTVTHNNGTINFYLPAGVSKTIANNGASLYNVNLGNGSANSVYTLGGNLIASGLLTINLDPSSSLLGGVLTANAGLNIISLPNTPTRLTPTLKFAGSGSQTFTGSYTYLPRVQIATSGSLDWAVTGTPYVAGTFTYSSGTVTWTNPTLAVLGENTNFAPGTLNYQNVTLALDTGKFMSVVGTAQIDGNLTLETATCTSCPGGITGGAINLKGNLIDNANINWGGAAKGFVTPITFVGGGSHTWNGNSCFGSFCQVRDVTISDGSTVTLASSVDNVLKLTVTNGTLDMAGRNLTLQATGTLDLTGAVINKNGGTLKIGSTVIGTGALYGGTINP